MLRKGLIHLFKQQTKKGNSQGHSDATAAILQGSVAKPVLTVVPIPQGCEKEIKALSSIITRSYQECLPVPRHISRPRYKDKYPLK